MTYSRRNGLIGSERLYSFEDLKRKFIVKFDKLAQQNYFRKWLGVIEKGQFKKGIIDDIQDKVHRFTRKDIWPIGYYIERYDESALFDIIEFLFEHCEEAQPHSTGYGVYYTYDREKGQKAFCSEINYLLEEYKEGDFILSDDGKVLRHPQVMKEFLDEAVFSNDNKEKITFAKQQFFRRSASEEDKLSALKTLADLLEPLRKEKVISEILGAKHDNELGNILNQYGIRHFNSDQKTNYDKDIWYEWMFYTFLNALSTLTKIKDAQIRQK